MQPLARHRPVSAKTARERDGRELTKDSDWASLSIGTTEFMAASSVLAGRNLSAPRDPQVVIPTPGSMANLLRAQTTACNLAETSPHLLANAEIARALKQSLRSGSISTCRIYPAL
jgi:hypothetical protein